MLMDRLRLILTPFFSRRLGVVLLLGFSSGLPLALTGSTLQAWMATENVDIRTIGLFTLAGIPYTWKFLWSPFMDRFVMPFLGRRRGWMLVTQLALMGSVAALGSLSATGSVGWLAWMAIGVAFLSASQDIVIDAYRTDLLLADERGLGSGLAVLGYRIGMLVSGALALLMASVWGWSTTYMVMAAFMGVGLMATLLGPEPTVHSAPPPTLKQAVLLPLKDFLSRSQAGPLLALIVLYKLGDAFAGALTTAFLIKGVGFSIVEVGTVNKGVGLLATLSGALVGGVGHDALAALLRIAVVWSAARIGCIGLRIAGDRRTKSIPYGAECVFRKLYLGHGYGCLYRIAHGAVQPALYGYAIRLAFSALGCGARVCGSALWGIGNGVGLGRILFVFGGRLTARRVVGVALAVASAGALMGWGWGLTPIGVRPLFSFSSKR